MNNIGTKFIRNIAVIAHVDHGKTTLVDRMLQHAGTIKTVTSDRVMDSNTLEKERGITILAKNTGLRFKDYQINIVDTPGHADFGGEVERTLQMVEGFLLLVDAAEGVLPGTRFVLSKALALNLKPIVVINKIDRPDATPVETEEAIHDLFLDLAKDDSQLNFPVLYGSTKHSFMGTDPHGKSGTMEPLFEAILNTIPSPKDNSADPLQFLVTNLEYSDFLGSIAVGRIFSGSMNVGDQFVWAKDDFTSQTMKITKIYGFEGLNKIEMNSASCGEIVAIAGFTKEPSIGATVCPPQQVRTLPYVAIDEPTLSVYISVNDSPFNGREGKLLTSRQIKERLEKELRTNVALRVEPTESPDVFKVSGRGQLHLSILVENMRREGFELQISAPEVIYKTVNGEKFEPMERVIIDVPNEYQGVVIENLGKRKGEMIAMNPYSDIDRTRIEFKVPSRTLIGFRSQFLTDTRGTGIANFSFEGYENYKGEVPTRTKGSLISMENGSVTAYALDGLQPRGILFVKPGEEIYEGMIVGEHSRDNDLDVNPCKQKKLTNMRASGTDDAVKLIPPKIMDLETCMEWIDPSELIEVTPKSIRLRKKVLRASLRK
jgi:GTP-binding protein